MHWSRLLPTGAQVLARSILDDCRHIAVDTRHRGVPAGKRFGDMLDLLCAQRLVLGGLVYSTAIGTIVTFLLVLVSLLQPLHKSRLTSRHLPLSLYQASLSAPSSCAYAPLLILSHAYSPMSPLTLLHFLANNITISSSPRPASIMASPKRPSIGAVVSKRKRDHDDGDVERGRDGKSSKRQR